MDEPEITGLRPVAEIKRAPIVVEDNQLLLDTGRFEQMQRVAMIMANCKSVPKHLQNEVSDCFRVVNQAMRWRLDPFAVAEKSFFVGGKLAYEGQLIAAVVNTRAGLEGRLRYEFEGDPAQPKTLKVTVSGRFAGDTHDSMVTVAWQTGRSMAKGAVALWDSQPEQQLSYYAARVFARRHCPDVILGAYTIDELADERVAKLIDVTPTGEVTSKQDKLSQMEEMLRRAKEVVASSVGVAQTNVQLEDLGQNSGHPEVEVEDREEARG